MWSLHITVLVCHVLLLDCEGKSKMLCFSSPPLPAELSLILHLTSVCSCFVLGRKRRPDNVTIICTVCKWQCIRGNSTVTCNSIQVGKLKKSSSPHVSEYMVNSSTDMGVGRGG